MSNEKMVILEPGKTVRLETDEEVTERVETEHQKSATEANEDEDYWPRLCELEEAVDNVQMRLSIIMNVTADRRLANELRSALKLLEDAMR